MDYSGRPWRAMRNSCDGLHSISRARFRPWPIRETFCAAIRSYDRRQVVDDFLESPHYITNFSNFWTRVMMPESATDLQGLAQRPGFQAWLRQHLGNNTHYDAIVYELLTTPLAGRSQ